MAGVTRESVSLEMNHAKARELMWKEGHSTYIDVSKLDTEAMPAVIGHPQLTEEPLDDEM